MESDIGERVILMSLHHRAGGGGGDSHINVTGMLAFSLRPKLQVSVSLTFGGDESH